MRWYIIIMLSTHFFLFRHLRIFAHLNYDLFCLISNIRTAMDKRIEYAMNTLINTEIWSTNLYLSLQVYFEG